MKYGKGRWKKKALLFAVSGVLAAGAGSVRAAQTQTKETIVVFAAENSLSKTSLTVSKGETYTITVKGNYKEVVWSTSNRLVAAVDKKGVVKGVAAGNATITANVDGMKYRCKVTVETPKLNRTKVTGKIGGTYRLTVSGTGRKVTYKSSDKSVVKVSSKGKLSFLKPGKATVTASIGNSKLKCKVTVENSVFLAVKYNVYDGLTKMDAQTAKKARKVLDAEVAGEMAEIEKIEKLHDYLVKNTAYDTDYRYYTVADTLLLNTAVCQGYAETMQLFLDVLGVENKLIYGTAGGDLHVWNLICLDGVWYHLDVTWDDPLDEHGKDMPGYVRHSYFMLSDAEMGKDHSWKTSEYPKASGGTYENYIEEKTVKQFLADGLFAENEQEFVEIVIKCVDEGQNEITVLCEDTAVGSEGSMKKLVEEIAHQKQDYSYRINWQVEKIGIYTKVMLEVMHG